MLGFNPLPKAPQEIIDAAESGMLVVFIGAGISRLAGCPSWSGFASAILNQLTPDAINYHERSLINSIKDPRKQLSIAKIIEEKSPIKVDYKSIFHIDNEKSDIYTYINKLSCNFVTTNYDKLINPEISATEPEETWRYYKIDDILRDKLDLQGSVIHLHGCVDDPENMVITTKDYLSHYRTKQIPEFLDYLFETKTVLFLGYGLEETEILEYILKGSNHGGKGENKLFILQGFFNAEEALCNKLSDYYEESFNAKLIPYPRDFDDYEQQKQIIKKWAEELDIRAVAAFDELAAMEDELDD